jgi:hypothetical protein
MTRASTLKNYDLVGSYNNQRSTTGDSQRTVNEFEYLDPEAKRPKSLFPTSGLVNTNLNFIPETGGSRASFVFNDFIYQVFGGTVYRIGGNSATTLTKTILGTLTTSQGYIGVDANTFQILFVDREFGYIFDTNTLLFRQITDDAFPAQPIDCCYLDGFFVVINGGTNQFELSSFNQGLIWGVSTTTFTADDTAGNNWLILSSTTNFQTGTPFTVSTTGALPNPLVAGTTYYAINVDSTHIRVATSAVNAALGIAIVLTSNGSPVNTIDNDGQLQEGQVTTHPGTLVACKTLHRKIFFFSQNFTEVWENKGIGSNLPFRRNNGLLMEVGTPATGSVALGFDRMYFLSQDKDGLGSVMEVTGSQATPVSPRSLDFQLAQYAAMQIGGDSFVNDARGILIKENGLIFYRLNFTLADHTFVYCPTMSTPGDFKWHEEEILDESRHPAQTHAYYRGVNYYGDYHSAIFYAVDASVSTNAGESIKRMRIGNTLAPEGYNRLRVDRFQVDLKQGVVGEQNIDFVLDTESSLDILTETGLDLLLDQSSIVQGEQPYVYLSISKDGGQTYGYRQKALMGKIGERTYRTVWRKLGTIPRGQGFTPKIEFFHQVPFIVLGAAWSYEIMPE